MTKSSDILNISSNTVENQFCEPILSHIKSWTLNIKMNRCIYCLIASNKHKLCPKIEAIDFYISAMSTVR